MFQVVSGCGTTLRTNQTSRAAHDYTGHALVAREARTPIQCGENWWGTLDMEHAIEAHASDFVMADVMKIGGVTGWLRAATLAHTKGIQVSNHLWPEIRARLLCCTPTAHLLEYADWWNPILAEPLRVEKGMAIFSDAIGTGSTGTKTRCTVLQLDSSLLATSLDRRNEVSCDR